MTGSAVGAHGRDISAAEAAWSSHPAAALFTAQNPVTFRDVLSALNPLQYLPVVGTIYRVVTGDEGSPGLRTVVSAISGVLTGGVGGLLTSIVAAMVERALPVDQIARGALVGQPSKPTGTAAPQPEAAVATAPPAAAAAPTPTPAPTAAEVTLPVSAALASIAVAAYQRVQGVGRSG